MKDYFKCHYCGNQFRIVVGIRRGELTFCSHKCEVYYKVWKEKEEREHPFPDYPER